MLIWKITRLIFFLLLLLGAYTTVGAQNQILRWQGTVVDSLTKTPLAFVNISIVGTTTGSNSNVDGVFNLNLHLGDRLRFSYVGYADKVFSVTTSLLAQKVILLSEKDVLLNEFVLTPEMNPA